MTQKTYVNKIEILQLTSKMLRIKSKVCGGANILVC